MSKRVKGTDGKWVIRDDEASTRLGHDRWIPDPNQNDDDAPGVAASPKPGYKKGDKMPTQAEHGAKFGGELSRWREAQRAEVQAKALEKKKVP